MGGGHYSDDAYYKSRATRQARGEDDFEYTKHAKTVNPKLDPKRILTKPFKALESRDNDDHPNSNAIVVGFDCTGSNIENARIVQKKLPTLMGLLGQYVSDPQIMIAANDDIQAFSHPQDATIQLSEFESDIRIDESIRNLLLTGDGGGNDGESYELMMYGIARRTITDCWEKRKRKGYFFLYADEPMRLQVLPEDVKMIYGDTIEERIPLEQIIKEISQRYHIFVMWPANSSYQHSYEQYKHVFGAERVRILEDANYICEFMGTLIGMTEKKLSAQDATKQLVKLGASMKVAKQLVGASR